MPGGLKQSAWANQWHSTGVRWEKKLRSRGDSANATLFRIPGTKITSGTKPVHPQCWIMSTKGSSGYSKAKQSCLPGVLLIFQQIETLIIPVHKPRLKF